ncbi:hypothetical protein LSAT2_003708 [Lamellibrachia satsuma]|nr:hypothetical protein LSAT2_003708 [Lamellibrachia satsuma]
MRLPRWGVARETAPPHGECQPPAGEVITLTRLTRPALCAKFELASALRGHKDSEGPASAPGCHSGNECLIALERYLSGTRTAGRRPQHEMRPDTALPQHNVPMQTPAPVMT